MTQHRTVLLSMLPITLAVFVGFLIIGMQLPVLPLHLNQTLGMDTLVVGVVIGAQFAAALLSRAWAGNFADMRGPKRAMLLGMLVTASSGLLYLASLAFVDSPVLSVWVLVAGRVVLALGESLVITGSMGWGMGRVGPQNTGKVMAWIGIAIYAAFALGAPLGVVINRQWGFSGLSIASLILPLLAFGIVAGAQGVAPTSQRRTSFYAVLGSVWLPGLGLALSSIGSGVITAFVALLFASKDWGNASFAFTAFGLAFIGARIFFGHLPDKLGGAIVALVCVLIEAAGQLLIWGANDPLMAYLGAAFTGFGYSLAFPGFGVEAIKRAPPQTRGLAMGAYVAFLDISLGITSPLAGALAGVAGVASVYLAGSVAVALSALVAWVLLAKKPLLSAC